MLGHRASEAWKQVSEEKGCCADQAQMGCTSQSTQAQLRVSWTQRKALVESFLAFQHPGAASGVHLAGVLSAQADAEN